MRVIPTDEMLDTQFRASTLPHIWCPGCSHGIVTRALADALAQTDADRDRTVLISGIGCSSRATGYLDYYTVHTTHGRALPVATGLKLARPELRVVVISGDGDTGAIGTSHLVHAARRNIDLTLVCYANGTYGMTGGQGAPTTRPGEITTTSPTGHLERPLDLCALAQASGASYVARSTAWHYDLLVRVIARGLDKRGFALVVAESSCPVYAGRLNDQDSPARMLFAMREAAVADPGAPLGPGQYRIGELWNVDAPEYAETYWRHAKEEQSR
jgi:2-oxoglutarate/2-oxoacid ferredoxin oxidoreductase subunit beta